MKKWKKFIAMGLAVSMIVPSCIPQTLWASEFSAGSVESAADVFEDGAGYETGSESGNKISDENNSGDEFGTGELKDQEPHTTKFQLAPCQRPVRNHTIRRFSKCRTECGRL